MLEIWLAFSAGLAGSAHCLGMCGGIVSALAMTRSKAGAVERLLFNLLYHLGRIAMYATLGLVVGLLAQTGMTELLKPYMRPLFITANGLVIVMGLATMINIRSFGIAALDGAGYGFLQGILGRLNAGSSVFSAFPVGLVMGLIPCGLVYGVLISAASSASLVKGGAMMLAFGLGTLPALLAFGQAASSLAALGGGAFRRIMGLIVALLGAACIWRLLAA